MLGRHLSYNQLGTKKAYLRRGHLGEAWDKEPVQESGVGRESAEQEEQGVQSPEGGERWQRQLESREDGPACLRRGMRYLARSYCSKAFLLPGVLVAHALHSFKSSLQPPSQSGLPWPPHLNCHSPLTPTSFLCTCHLPAWYTTWFIHHVSCLFPPYLLPEASGRQEFLCFIYWCITNIYNRAWQVLSHSFGMELHGKAMNVLSRDVTLPHSYFWKITLDAEWEGCFKSERHFSALLYINTRIWNQDLARKTLNFFPFKIIQVEKETTRVLWKLQAHGWEPQ